MTTTIRQTLRLVSIMAIVGLNGFRANAAEASDPTQEPSVIAVAKAMPAVVNISTERVIRRTVRDPSDDFFRDFFGQMRPPREIRQTVQSLGSGFIVDPEGYIVTNEHVVERAAEMRISVTTYDGKTFNARYITGSTEADLALIKIEDGKTFPYINLNDLSPNLLGQTVLVLGNPVGYGSSVARGILSAKNRAVEIGNVEYRDLIQTDAAINPGNSGGPVVDLGGKLVGVSSVKMAFTPQGVPTQGIGFAIPGEVIRDKVVAFRKTAAQAVAKGGLRSTHDEPFSNAKKFFGLTLQDLTPELGESLGVGGTDGVLISDVEADSPASQGGLRRGQVIYEIGRYEVSSVKQIEELLGPVDKGSVVDLTIGGTERFRGALVRRLKPVTLRAR